ncbi:MAG TPA: hypothetical protein PLX90_03295, partial [Anaerolineales bacterium]|nr:hypothetical protein [Anaerolineales bacterium]
SALSSSTLTLSNTQNLGKFLSIKTLKISNSLKALRLAKEGEFNQKSVLLLEELLNGQNDLLRYETQQVLSGIKKNLSKSSIESLAESSEYQSHRTEIAWALYRVIITQPEWIDDWVVQKKISVLESIRNISGECISTWAGHIINSDQDVKRAILHSTRWILNAFDAYDNILPITNALLEYVQGSSDEEMLEAAFYALGFSKQNNQEIIERIFSVLREKDFTEKTISQVYATLARLTDGMKDETADKVADILQEKIDSLFAASAFVYVKIKRSKDIRQAEKELKNILPDNQKLIKASVLAGSDDAEWAEYHDDIVDLVISLLKQGDEKSIRVSVEMLQESINQPWPQNRITLAVISKGLEELGDAISTTVPLPELEKLLLSGTKEHGSFNSRRFSIRSLSSLRIVSSEALKALFKSCTDVNIVLKQSIEAAGRFRRLAKDFSEDQAILNLVEVFEQESVTAAYIAVKLLAELGSSPAVLEIPNLRKKIAIELSKVITKPIAQQDVYLPFENDLEKPGLKIFRLNRKAVSVSLNRLSDSVFSYGKLSTHILSGLVKVVGLPEK